MSGKRRRSSAPSARPARRKRRSVAPKPVAAPSSRPARRSRGLALLLAVTAVSIVYGPLLIWAHWPGSGAPSALSSLPLGAQCEAGALADQLTSLGLIRSPGLFRWYLRLAHPAFHCLPRVHLLAPDLSASEIVARIDGSPLRASVRVTIPEGLDHVDIGARLEAARVCGQAQFHDAVSDPALLAELAISGASAEGYLFPATYGLAADSDAAEVVRTLVAEARKRLGKLREQHPGAFEALAARGLDERAVLTLASMIEKEARAADERALIASVFFNRLSDADFRPLHMLQSDPSASYACRVRLPNIPSCADFHGSVTPALLRDAANPYNTYRHPGLPPGPIANPGEATITAVLAPAQTDYLYFVAKGGGRHTFSKTFAEHRDAIESGR